MEYSGNNESTKGRVTPTETFIMSSLDDCFVKVDVDQEWSDLSYLRDGPAKRILRHICREMERVGFVPGWDYIDDEEIAMGVALDFYDFLVQKMDVSWPVIDLVDAEFLAALYAWRGKDVPTSTTCASLGGFGSWWSGMGIPRDVGWTRPRAIWRRTRRGRSWGPSSTW